MPDALPDSAWPDVAWPEDLSADGDPFDLADRLGVLESLAQVLDAAHGFLVAVDEDQVDEADARWAMASARLRRAVDDRRPAARAVAGILTDAAVEVRAYARRQT